MDTFNREGALVIRLDLPGVDPEKDLRLEVQNGVLEVRGERRDGRFQSGVPSRPFERRIELPEDARPEEAWAIHRLGVVEVTVPRVRAGRGILIPGAELRAGGIAEPVWAPNPDEEAEMPYAHRRDLVFAGIPNGKRRRGRGRSKAVRTSTTR